MNLFELFVKIGVKDEASKNISNITSKLGNGLKTAAKIGTAAVGAAAAGITALTTAAVNNYAEYEQLVGGVETLFKTSADTVQKYAANAYKTAGLSANEYMSTVTSFSASLLQSLGGDTEAAAKYADMAVSDMSDNANKMGTDMELIQNAYQGFAKQNYTMLDNLKLGYGGTKTEMERLLKDAEKISGRTDLLWGKDGFGYGFAEIVDAIHIVQKEMGIYGTTALEAEKTISGSLNSMKAAWSNLVTGLADDEADFDALIGNMVSTVETFAGNIIPRIEIALGGIADLIGKIAPIIVEKLPSLVDTLVPSLINAATGMVNSVIAVLPSLLETVVTALVENAPLLIEAAIGLVNSLIQGIQDNAQILIDGAISMVMTLANGILSMLPEIIKLGLDLILSLANGIAENLPEIIPTVIEVINQIMTTITENLPLLVSSALEIITSLANGIAESLPELIPTIIDVVLQIVETLTAPETLINLIDAAVELLLALANGLIGAIPGLVERIPEIIGAIVSALIVELPTIIAAGWEILFALINGLLDTIPELSAMIPEIIIAIVEGIFENLDTLIPAALDIILTIAEGLIEALPRLIGYLPRIFSEIVRTFGEFDWGQIGKDLVEGFKNGIENAWTNLKEWFSGLFDDLIGIAKKILGIASPSKVFKKIGGFTAEGFGDGFDDEFSTVRDDMEKALSFDDVSVGINSSIKRTSDISGGSAFGATSGTMAELDSIRRDISMIASILMNGITLDANDRELGRFVRKYAVT